MLWSVRGRLAQLSYEALSADPTAAVRGTVARLLDVSMTENLLITLQRQADGAMPQASIENWDEVRAIFSSALTTHPLAALSPQPWSR